jgi:predicted DNA-binding mobile mystery protein A
MKSEFRELRVNQIDRSLEPFAGTQAVRRPQRGWLRSVREALGISMRDVARKMRKTPQTVASFEKSEAADRITLQTLRHYAEAMNCELVYAIVPKSGSLKQLGEKGARQKAEKDVRAVEHTMALEDQATRGVQDKIERETKRLLKKR